jgi:hypothetical protein
MRSFDPPDPPWVCDTCVRGFWAAELTDDAVGLWNSETRCYGDSLTAVALMDNVAAEAEQAEIVAGD